MLAIFFFFFFGTHASSIRAIGTANPCNDVEQSEFPDFYFRITNSDHIDPIYLHGTREVVIPWVWVMLSLQIAYLYLNWQQNVLSFAQLICPYVFPAHI
jgi:hypothetical protein